MGLTGLSPECFSPKNKKAKDNILSRFRCSPSRCSRKYNSLYKVLRVLGYVKRFVSKLKKELKKFPRYATASELAVSAMILLPQKQRKAYSEEIKTLKKAPQVIKESVILSFYLFLYDSVVCIGGRSAHDNLPDESKYQRLIQQSSQVARLVVSNAHL